MDAKVLNSKTEKEKLITEAPDQYGLPTDDEIEAEERAEFEKRLADRKAQRDADFKKKDDERISKEKAEQRKSELKAKADKILKELGSNPSFEDAFDKLVPSSGACESVGAELIRAVNRLEYRWLNDGDRFFAGYGLETCGSPAAFISDNVEEYGKPSKDDIDMIISDAAENNLNDDDYTNFIDTLKERIIKLVFEEHPELLGEPLGEKDIHSWTDGEEYWDDYIPRDYDFTFTVSDKVQEYLDRGDISSWNVIQEINSWMDSTSITEGLECDTPWGYSDSEYTISNLTEEQYEELDSWDSDSLWSDFEDELESEFGVIADVSDLEDQCYNELVNLKGEFSGKGYDIDISGVGVDHNGGNSYICSFDLEVNGQSLGNVEFEFEIDEDGDVSTQSFQMDAEANIEDAIETQYEEPEETDESLNESKDSIKSLVVKEVKPGQTFKPLEDLFYCDITEEGMFEDDEELVKEFTDNGFKLEGTSLIIPAETIIKFTVSQSVDSYEIGDYSFDVGEWSEEAENTPVELIVNGYVIGKFADGGYSVYNNEGHFEEDKNNGYDTVEKAIKRAKSLPKGIAIEVDESLKEAYNNEEMKEFMNLCNKLGFTKLVDIDKFAKEHGNVKDQELLQAMRDAVKGANESLKEGVRYWPVMYKEYTYWINNDDDTDIILYDNDGVIITRADSEKQVKDYIDNLTSKKESLKEDYNYDEDAFYQAYNNGDIYCQIVKDDDDDDFMIVDDWEEVQKIQKLLSSSFESKDKYDSFVLDNFMSWGFSDSYCACDNCGKLICTEPDSKHWTPDFFIDDNGIICGDCVRKNPQEYLQSLANNSEVANTILSESDLEDAGFVKLDGDYQNGWYDRQDDPKSILNDLLDRFPYGVFIFNITTQAQFATNFDVWGEEATFDEYDEDEETDESLKEASLNERMTDTYESDNFIAKCEFKPGRYRNYYYVHLIDKGNNREYAKGSYGWINRPYEGFNYKMALLDACRKYGLSDEKINLLREKTAFQSTLDLFDELVNGKKSDECLKEADKETTIKIDPNKPMKEIEFGWELVKVDTNGKETVLNKGSEEEMNNLKLTTKDTPNQKFIVRKSEKTVNESANSMTDAVNKNTKDFTKEKGQMICNKGAQQEDAESILKKHYSNVESKSAKGGRISISFSGLIKNEALKEEIKKVFTDEEVNDLTKSIYDTLEDNGIYPEDAYIWNYTTYAQLQVTISGDWKHDHLFAEDLIEDVVNSKGYKITNTEEDVTEDNGSDSYTSIHYFYLER